MTMLPQLKSLAAKYRNILGIDLSALVAEMERMQKADKAIDDCLDWANNRWDEWGERALNAKAFLTKYVEERSANDAAKGMEKKT